MTNTCVKHERYLNSRTVMSFGGVMGIAFVFGVSIYAISQIEMVRSQTTENKNVIMLSAIIAGSILIAWLFSTAARTLRSIPLDQATLQSLGRSRIPCLIEGTKIINPITYELTLNHPDFDGRTMRLLLNYHDIRNANCLISGHSAYYGTVDVIEVNAQQRITFWHVPNNDTFARLMSIFFGFNPGEGGRWVGVGNEKLPRHPKEDVFCRMGYLRDYYPVANDDVTRKFCAGLDPETSIVVVQGGRCDTIGFVPLTWDSGQSSKSSLERFCSENPRKHIYVSDLAPYILTGAIEEAVWGGGLIRPNHVYRIGNESEVDLLKSE